MWGKKKNQCNKHNAEKIQWCQRKETHKTKENSIKTLKQINKGRKTKQKVGNFVSDKHMY